MTERKTTTRGFTRTSTLLQKRIRHASESRGFANSRLLTQWTEIAGPQMAAISRPVEVSYARQGMGATLTLLTTGAQAPMLEMQKEQLRDKVNAVYGYNAIARIRITQTAASGFSEGQVDFDHRAERPEPARPDPAMQQRAEQITAPIGDTSLRSALEALGQNVLSKQKQ